MLLSADWTKKDHKKENINALHITQIALHVRAICDVETEMLSETDGGHAVIPGLLNGCVIMTVWVCV